MFDDTFGCVKVLPFFSRNEIIHITTETEYKKYLNDNQLAIEIIGATEQQIKPVFDVDSYDTPIDNDHIANVISDMFPNKPIYIARREPRHVEGKGLRYSEHICVGDVRITWRKLRDYIELKGYDKLFDMNIYGTNRALFMPLTKYKYNDIDKKQKVPELKVINGSLFDCCASYVLDTYEDWTPIVNNLQPTKPAINYTPTDDQQDDEFTNHKSEFIKEIIEHISNKRADKYDSWLSVMFAIIGACKKSGIKMRECNSLLHQFSSKSEESYEEDKVEDWIYANYKKQMDRTDAQYGYRYLIHTCIKEDDNEYYNEKYNPKFKKTYDQVAKNVNAKVFKMDNLMMYIVLNERHDKWETDVIGQYDKNELKHKFAQNEDYTYYDKKTNKKGEISYEQVNIFDNNSKWWKDTSVKKYDKFVFIPDVDEVCPYYYYNLFQGFAIDKYPICSTNANLEVIMYHINNVLGNGDKPSADFILQWYAHILMGKKTNVCIMQQGIEGGGKTLMYDKFAENIIGKKYTFTTSKPAEQLFGRFNDHLGNKIIVKIEEGTAELRSHMDKFKDMITGIELPIEAKFAKTVTLQNNINPVICTNNFNILSVSTNDRRFAIFETNPEHVGNVQYFDRLGDALDDMETMSAFANMLRTDVYIPKYNFQKSRPKTRIYKRLVQTNISNVFQFIKSYDYEWRTYRGETYAIIKRSKLYSDYKSYTLENKFECYNLNAFENKLTENPKYGIVLVKYANCPSYKITKDVFLTAMQNFDIEDIPVFNDFEFLDD